MGIVLGESTLDDVVKKLGKATKYDTGDAGIHEFKVCYQIGSKERLVFASNSEMAQGVNITSIRIYGGEIFSGDTGDRAGGDDSQNSRWDKLDRSLKEIRTQSGLWIGMTKGTVKKILGKPIDEKSDGWRYVWDAKVPFKKSDPNYKRWLSKKEECFGGEDPFYDVNSSITIDFTGNKVNVIKISRMESAC